MGIFLLTPKVRQKKVMQQARPDAKYTVLYRHNLEAIQQAHPEITIFERPSETQLAA